MLRSHKKQSTYGLKIYAAGSNGKPADLLYDNLIIGNANKGYKVSKIDVSDYGIQIPKNGIVIVFEWLTINENRHSISYTNDSKRKTMEIFNPTIYATEGDSTIALVKYFHVTNKWQNETNSTFFDKSQDGIVPVIMCELTLTN